MADSKVIHVQSDQNLVRCGNSHAQLGKRDFALFTALWRHRDRVVSYHHLSRQLWGDEPQRPSRLRLAILKLRRKLLEQAPDAIQIINVTGLGYRMSVTAHVSVECAQLDSNGSGFDNLTEGGEALDATVCGA